MAVIALPTSASSWEFTPVPICTLTGQTEKGSVTVTYDPAAEIYAINLTMVTDVWDEHPNFSIQFIGPRGRQIGTALHTLSADKATLTVTDKGFANVLDGIEFNVAAQAQSGTSKMTMSLAGAADPVQAFRACSAGALS